MYLQRFFLAIVIFTLTACSDRSQETTINKLNVGIVSYEIYANDLNRYDDLKSYVGTQLNIVLEIEPAFNEIRALEQVAQQRWDLVFAPPGLAAIAISEYNYEPILPLDGRDDNRSVIVVKNDSQFAKRQDLAGETIALGQKGSATGYYLPLYNLYGLNLGQVYLSPTPKTVLQWIDSGKVTAGGLSLAEYNLHRRDFSPNKFKILYLDKHNVPPGAILLSNRLEENQRKQLKWALSQASSRISSSVGFLPRQEVPNYSYLTKVIKRVQEISENLPVQVP